MSYGVRPPIRDIAAFCEANGSVWALTEDIRQEASRVVLDATSRSQRDATIAYVIYRGIRFDLAPNLTVGPGITARAYLYDQRVIDHRAATRTTIADHYDRLYMKTNRLLTLLDQTRHEPPPKALHTHRIER